MKKLMSLIKACMTDNMNLFRLKQKNKSAASKKIFPIFIAIIFLFAMWSYANMVMEPLAGTGNEVLVLTIFILFSVILTVIEGIYKTSSLLFNCKDDNLLLSLPIKKTTVLFIRIFKFYVFELMYNTILVLPAMVVYASNVSVSWTYYLVSAIALLIIPIVPIVFSCIVGGITSLISTKFKYKNIAQIVFTTIALIGVMFLSFNLKSVLGDLAQNATSINDLITKIYYPAGAYASLATEFNIVTLLIYIGSHLALVVLTIFVLSKIYFKINSRAKSVTIGSSKKEYKVKTKKPIRALIKKELNRFTTSPVFIINAGFGLVLFILITILTLVKFDSVPEMLAQMELNISEEQIREYMPLILFGFICFTSFMTSITCSMISLEGKTFNLLKSLPLKPFTIIFSKVLTAVLVMIPFILIGDILFFIRFGFNIIEMMFILIATFVLPILSETIGILINLKYPKMDAENDTEVVKQSTSTMLSSLLGMLLTGVSIIFVVMGINSGINIDLVLEIGVALYTLICGILVFALKRSGAKSFLKINV